MAQIQRSQESKGGMGSQLLGMFTKYYTGGMAKGQEKGEQASGAVEGPSQSSLSLDPNQKMNYGYGNMQTMYSSGPSLDQQNTMDYGYGGMPQKQQGPNLMGNQNYMGAFQRRFQGSMMS